MKAVGIVTGLLAISSAAGLSAAPRTGWMATFTQTGIGSFLVGNRNAPTKLTEYVSYTCDHCANFEALDAPRIKRGMVAKGQVSFEIRNFVRDPIDLTIAMLARCRGKGRFFGNHRFLLANQDAIMDRTGQLTKKTKNNLKNSNLHGFALGAYTDMALKDFTRKRGISDAKAKKCLASKPAMKKILDMTEAAGTRYGVKATPTILVNGKIAKNAYDFASIKRYLALKQITTKGTI